jgi:predicted amidophosphoribosyltransferase
MPTLLAALIDLVLPQSCVGCGRDGAALCASCASSRLVQVDAAGLPVMAAGDYAGGLRTALLAYKERGRRDLAGPLGGLLARAVPTGAAALVPVPCAPAAARARGGDHVLRLARVAARRLGLRVATPLRLDRAVEDSAGLGLRERARNLHEAMVATPARRPGEAVVIIDDIVTTGATLREAARALECAGWPVGSAAVVAATARRPPGTSVPTGLP